MDKTWAERAHALRAEGLSVRQIAAQVGRSRSTVGELLTPHYCRCGNVCAHHRAQCRECYDSARRAERLERAHLIAFLWANGSTLAEIAEEVGWTVNVLGTEMHRLRNEGLVDLPLRERVGWGKWGWGSPHREAA